MRVKFYPDDRIYLVFFLVPRFSNEQTKVYFGGNIYNLSEINSVRKRGKRAVLGTLNLDNIKNTTTGIALSYYYTTFRYSGENIKLLQVLRYKTSFWVISKQSLQSTFLVTFIPSRIYVLNYELLFYRV